MCKFPLGFFCLQEEFQMSLFLCAYQILTDHMSTYIYLQSKKNQNKNRILFHCKAV